MRIELHIGRIVLEGTDSHDAPAVRVALEAELATLLTRTPLTPATPHRAHRIKSPVLPPTATPTAFGQALAHAIHGTLTHHTRGSIR